MEQQRSKLYGVRSKDTWTPPENPNLKLNVDASIGKDSVDGAITGILRRNSTRRLHSKDPSLLSNSGGSGSLLRGVIFLDWREEKRLISLESWRERERETEGVVQR